MQNRTGAQRVFMDRSNQVELSPVVRGASVLIIALVFLVSASWAHAQSPVTLADYIGRVEQAIDLTGRASALSAEERQSMLNQAATLIEEVHAVQLDSGDPETVDNASLASALRDPNQTASALGRLRALRSSLDALPATMSAADRARVRDILNRPPFQEEQAPFWTQYLDEIGNFLNRLLRSTAQGVWDWRDVVTVLGVLLTVGVLFYLFWNLRRNAVPESSLPGEDENQAALTSGSALGRAHQFANGGDYRAAMRELYLATLLLLDERGRVRFDHALTNREYLQAAAREPEIAAALSPVVDAFDRVWYGFERVTPDEFLAYSSQVENVRKQVLIA